MTRFAVHLALPVLAVMGAAIACSSGDSSASRDAGSSAGPGDRDGGVVATDVGADSQVDDAGAPPIGNCPWAPRRTCRPTHRGSWSLRPRPLTTTASCGICRVSSPVTPRSPRRRSSCSSPIRRWTGRATRSWASGTRPAGATHGSLRSPGPSPGSSYSKTQTSSSLTPSFTSKAYAPWPATRARRAPSRSFCRHGHPRQPTPQHAVRSRTAWATALARRWCPPGTHGRRPYNRKRMRG